MRPWPHVGVGLQQYEWLQARVAAEGDFAQDPEFRRHFNRFYRVRRDPQWRDSFYGLMRRGRRDPLEFRAVLDALHTVTNRYEASFASKLVATLDPSKPVIDRFVLKNTGLRLPAPAAANRAERICQVYEELISGFSAFLNSEPGHYLVDQFKRTYPDATVTNVKMLDLVLWQTPPRAFNSRSAREGAGSKTRLTQRSRPTCCPSCGGPRVAEIFYGLPADDEELNRDLRAGRIGTRRVLCF